MGLYSMQGQPHQQQGEQTAQQPTPYSRPASIVQPQQANAPPSQHHPGYPSASISSVYQPPGNQPTASNQPSDGLPYYTHPAYHSTGSTSGYSSAGTSLRAHASMCRCYRWSPSRLRTLANMKERIANVV